MGSGCLKFTKAQNFLVINIQKYNMKTEQMCKCVQWARLGGPLTDHHPNCEHFNDSLITVWKVSHDRSHCYMDFKPDAEDFKDDEVITEEKMHRELFERLPEFNGF